jgi:nucleoside-triphosphatase
MRLPRHVLICGDVGAGKSTLIEKLLRESSRPVYGFITKKASADENGLSPVYIHAANAEERFYTAENLIGYCSGKGSRGCPQVFDTMGLRLLEAPSGGILRMDELGFMESEAHAFCAAVLRALDGDIPVLAAVKSKETPFLLAVRAHPNAQAYWITRDNRDALYAQLLPVILGWNRGGG